MATQQLSERLYNVRTELEAIEEKLAAGALGGFYAALADGAERVRYAIGATG